MPDPLAETALAHTIHLAKTIGPRLAGSPAEEQARAYIADQLEGWGYQVEFLPAPFAPSPAIHYPNLVGAVALAGCAWALPYFPWLALGLPFLIAALPQWTMWIARRRKCTAETQNLFASLNTNNEPFGGSQDPYASLVLCAHIDSARAFPFRSKFWLRLHGRSMDIIQRVAVALALLGLLKGVEFSLPPGLLTAGGYIAGFTALIWICMQLWGVWRSDISPGAVDNASGAGVMLALAEYFAKHPPQHPRLGFLFSGAEETGAHGAQSFADYYRTQGKQTTFIVLDMVGAGNDLRYVLTDGVYFPLRTDSRLNQMIKKVCPQARPLNETLRSGDHAVFVRQGFPSAALQTSGSTQAKLAYHTVDDTVELLDTKSLELTIQCIIDMCEISTLELK